MTIPDDLRPEMDRTIGDRGRHDYAGSSRSSMLGPALVVACLLVGLLASIVKMQNGRIGDERQRVTLLATAADLSAGRGQELGQLMADAGTQFIHLSATETLPGRVAAVAWNSNEHRGALFCDLFPIQPTRRSFELWAIDAGGSASQLADINALPGVSVYPFNLAGAAARLTRFEVTVGPRSSAQGPLFSGTIADGTN